MGEGARISTLTPLKLSNKYRALVISVLIRPAGGNLIGGCSQSKKRPA